MFATQHYNRLCLEDPNPWLTTWALLKSRMGQPWSKPGEAYWRWTAAPFALVALVWADGRGEASQCTRWDGVEADESGETYWPCIIAVCVPDSDGRVPFYCPALARMGGRPWLVHTSRLFMLPRQWHQDQLLDFGDHARQLPFLPMSKL